MSLPASFPPVRDPTYYFPHGDTVLLVENTLFKVHRIQLIRDQSAFEGMFFCPTVTPPEGEHDDNPIRLYGDSVGEIRALMCYLYSSPHETSIQKDLTNYDNFHRRICLARVAHKYHFDSVQMWALEALKAFWTSCDESARSSFHVIMETTSVASLCQHADLIRIVTDAWINIVKVGNVGNIRLAINVAEEYGLPIVNGRACYAMMVLGSGVWDQDGVLTPPQRLKIMSGFRDLERIWEHLKMQKAPGFTHSGCRPTSRTAPPSPTANYCKLGWIYLWQMVFVHPVVQKMLHSSSPADVIGRLSYIADVVEPIHDEMLVPTDWKMAAGCLKCFCGFLVM